MDRQGRPQPVADRETIKLVAIDRITWNIIKAVLISMHKIITRYEKQYQILLKRL